MQLNVIQAREQRAPGSRALASCLLRSSPPEVLNERSDRCFKSLCWVRWAVDRQQSGWAGDASNCDCRKNWLFVGSPAVGGRAAILMSLIASCMLNRGLTCVMFLFDLLPYRTKANFRSCCQTSGCSQTQSIDGRSTPFEETKEIRRRSSPCAYQIGRYRILTHAWTMAPGNIATAAFFGK